ncbi:hypothetical protein HK104_005554 [Borealophlyctis nickersoniae]|nr:hypothetical protein HK104_005554 [Borealophlyctis nickersoniae]
MHDKREHPKPYDRPNNKEIVHFWCKETGHINSDCAKFKKYKREKAKVNNTDAKKEYNNASIVTRLDAVLTAMHVADAKNDVNPVTGPELSDLKTEELGITITHASGAMACTGPPNAGKIARDPVPSTPLTESEGGVGEF